MSGLPLASNVMRRYYLVRKTVKGRYVVWRETNASCKQDARCKTRAQRQHIKQLQCRTSVFTGKSPEATVSMGPSHAADVPMPPACRSSDPYAVQGQQYSRGHLQVEGCCPGEVLVPPIEAKDTLTCHHLDGHKCLLLDTAPVLYPSRFRR